MPRLKSITIENYRSIESPITINFPENKPVIIIGENNSGKTNILRAIDILFGESHPAYKDFDDHDYFGRNSNEKTKIRIEAEVEGFSLKNNKEYKVFVLEKSKNKTKYFALDKENKENKYISNEEREKLISIFIFSERNLNYQLSYSSKYTLLSKVIKSFHNKLTSNEERVKKLKDTYQKHLKFLTKSKNSKIKCLL